MRARVASALAVVMVLMGASLTTVPAEAATATARNLFSKLAVAAEHNSGYDRTKYFGGFIDADKDCQDTRAEVLIAESAVTPKYTTTKKCVVSSGKWTSRWDGKAHTKASAVQIDHHVPLHEAWGSGARKWTQAQRKAFTNDLYGPALNVMTSKLNSGKQAKDPAQWLPPKTSQRCIYAIWWVQVKYRWKLTIDSTEKAALNKIITGDCGRKLVTVPTIALVTPKPTPTVTPKPTPKPTPTTTAPRPTPTPTVTVRPELPLVAADQARLTRVDYNTFLLLRVQCTETVQLFMRGVLTADPVAGEPRTADVSGTAMCGPTAAEARILYAFPWDQPAPAPGSSMSLELTFESEGRYPQPDHLPTSRIYQVEEPPYLSISGQATIRDTTRTSLDVGVVVMCRPGTPEYLNFAGLNQLIGGDLARPHLPAHTSPTPVECNGEYVQAQAYATTVRRGTDPTIARQFMAGEEVRLTVSTFDGRAEATGWVTVATP